MVSLVSLFNRLLPFATPGTPIVQDIIHLGLVCALLYYAPQLQDRFRHNRQDEQQAAVEQEPLQEVPLEPEQNEELVENDQDHEHADQGEPANHDVPPDHDIPEGPVEGEAGPANAPNMPAQRNVGAKKAKSLAKRDQRRAYNEFMRSQGEAQRAKDAEGAAEREAQLAAERDRRQAAAAVLEAKKAKEREQRREQERRDRENEISRRDEVLRLVRRELDEAGTVNLFDVASNMGGDADEVWVEKILNAGGMLGWSPDGERLTLVLSTGWIAKISRQDMQRVYQKAASNGTKGEGGRISFEEIGRLLETVLKESR